MTVPLPRALVLVGLGGILGSLVRWVVTRDGTPSADFDSTVFAINVLGSGLLGALSVLTLEGSPARLFLGTGVLGGFTTMSAASVHAVLMADHDAVGLAAVYVLSTLIAAIGAAAVTRSVAARGLGRSGRGVPR